MVSIPTEIWVSQHLRLLPSLYALCRSFSIRFARLCASHIENYPLIEMYLVESCEKGEFPYAKEKNHLHERCTSLLPIRF